MIRRKLQGFASIYKRHTPNTLASDLNIDKLAKKVVNGNAKLKDVETSVLMAMKVLEGIKWFTQNNKNIKTGMLANRDNAITNNKLSFLPSLTEESVNRVPNNDAITYSTDKVYSKRIPMWKDK